MVRSGNAQAQRPLAAATTALAVTATLLLLAGPAVAGKPTTQSLLEVGATAASTTACSVSFPVKNPNSSGQTIEIGAMDTLSGEKVYSTTRIGGKETKTFTVSVPGSATYVGFAANSAGRTYSDTAASVVC